MTVVRRRRDDFISDDGYRKSSASGSCYEQVRSLWQVLPVPQSTLVRHSTQACAVTSHTGRALGQLAVLVHDWPQVWPLEQAGVLDGQSAPVRQSTQVCVAV
jgi:hypothetical protein